MEIEKVHINDLISPEWNPRQITDDELMKLKNSFEEFGYIDPIIVNDVNNHVVGGNQRLTVLKELGYTEVDVVYVHIDDINREKACNIALNKISGDWDLPKLQVVLEEIYLSPLNIELTGFDELQLETFNLNETTEENQEIVEDDYEEPENIEVNVKHGDLFQLGNHYLCCGDATIESEVNSLLNAKRERESM